MPMILHLVVYQVYAPMLIFKAVWMFLLIGPPNELCRLTHQKALMCFSLSSLHKHVVLTSSLPSLPVNGTLIPQAQKLKSVGVYLSYNLKWSGHISFVFTKVRKLSFYVRQLRSFSTSNFSSNVLCFLIFFPISFIDLL